MVTVDDSEIREALSECIASIVSAIRVALERTPPELSADISDRGIVLVGGGALLKNLDKRIREETGLPVSIPSDPLYCVVLGTGKMLSDFKLLRRISGSSPESVINIQQVAAAWRSSDKSRRRSSACYGSRKNDG
jgi:rod shape-determining protein MreB